MLYYVTSALKMQSIGEQRTQSRKEVRKHENFLDTEAYGGSS